MSILLFFFFLLFFLLVSFKDRLCGVVLALAGSVLFGLTFSFFESSSVHVVFSKLFESGSIDCFPYAGEVLEEFVIVKILLQDLDLLSVKLRINVCFFGLLEQSVNLDIVESFLLPSSTALLHLEFTISHFDIPLLLLELVLFFMLTELTFNLVSNFFLPVVSFFNSIEFNDG